MFNFTQTRFGMELLGFIFTAICFPVTIIAFYLQVRDLKKRTATLAGAFAIAYFENFLKPILSLIDEKGRLQVKIGKDEYEIVKNKVFIEIRIPLSLSTERISNMTKLDPVIILNNVRNYFMVGKYSDADHSITLMDIPSIFDLIKRTYEFNRQNEINYIYREAKAFKSTLEHCLSQNAEKYQIKHISISLFED